MIAPRRFLEKKGCLRAGMDLEAPNVRSHLLSKYGSPDDPSREKDLMFPAVSFASTPPMPSFCTCRDTPPNNHIVTSSHHDNITASGRGKVVLNDECDECAGRRCYPKRSYVSFRRRSGNNGCMQYCTGHEVMLYTESKTKRYRAIKGPCPVL